MNSIILPAVLGTVLNMNILTSDVDVLARTVWGEARGESQEAKIAVAAVVLNRVKQSHRRETTIMGAATEPFQFSCWNNSDPNRDKIYAVTLEDSSFRDSYRAALSALDGRDPTYGATHYHTIQKPKWAETWPPNWAKGHEPVAQIGDHLFYAGVR